MANQQIKEDIEQSRPNLRTPPDDNRKPGTLHRTSGRERQHRDRGMASDTPAWHEHVRRERD